MIFSGSGWSKVPFGIFSCNTLCYHQWFKVEFKKLLEKRCEFPPPKLLLIWLIFNIKCIGLVVSIYLVRVRCSFFAPLFIPSTGLEICFHKNCIEFHFSHARLCFVWIFFHTSQLTLMVVEVNIRSYCAIVLCSHKPCTKFIISVFQQYDDKRWFVW